MPYTKTKIGYQGQPREANTSYQAGRHKEGGKVTNREVVLKTIQSSVVPISATMIAIRLDWNILSVRPRLTELKNEGKIRDSGKRDETDMGANSIRWELID